MIFRPAAWCLPLILLPAVAIGPGPVAAASPQIQAAVTALEKIPADTAKFTTYCNLLGEMASLPDDDSAKYEALEAQLDKIIESYGQEVADAWDTLSEVDPDSEDGKAAAAAFEAMEAKCP
jgi:hypothetical protein